VNAYDSWTAPADTLARWAGDEFAIVCEEVEAPDAVTSLVARIRSELQRPFDLGDETVEVATSIGVAFVTESGDSPQTLLRDADRDMYRNKRGDNSRHRPGL
jgi:diguanylate cyclase (GGDEF)-like protein